SGHRPPELAAAVPGRRQERAPRPGGADRGGHDRPRGRAGPLEVNPFLLARLDVVSPSPPALALDPLEALVGHGLQAYVRRYLLVGERHGRYLTMSLGMPLLGGGAPVLRAWLRDAAGPPRFGVSVGARIEFVAFAAFWLLVTVVGGSVQ